MLTAQILNSFATLNDFDELGSIQFIPGAPFRLVLRLQQSQREDLLRYIPNATSTMTVSLPNKDGTTLDKTMTVFADDRSMWFVDISDTEADELAGGNLTFTLDDNGTTRKGFVENGLQLQITGDC